MWFLVGAIQLLCSIIHPCLLLSKRFYDFSRYEVSAVSLFLFFSSSMTSDKFEIEYKNCTEFWQAVSTPSRVPFIFNETSRQVYLFTQVSHSKGRRNLPFFTYLPSKLPVTMEAASAGASLPACTKQSCTLFVPSRPKHFDANAIYRLQSRDVSWGRTRTPA